MLTPETNGNDPDNEVVAVHNCPLSFRVRCSESWAAMRRTAIDGVRYCSECATDVYYCSTPNDVHLACTAGFCVAIDPKLGNYNDIAGDDCDDVALGMLDG